MATKARPEAGKRAKLVMAKPRAKARKKTQLPTTDSGSGPPLTCICPEPPAQGTVYLKAVDGEIVGGWEELP